MKVGEFFCFTQLSILAAITSCFSYSQCNMHNPLLFIVNNISEIIGNCLWSDCTLLRSSPNPYSHSWKIHKHCHMNQNPFKPGGFVPQTPIKISFAIRGFDSKPHLNTLDLISTWHLPWPIFFISHIIPCLSRLFHWVQSFSISISVIWFSLT